MPMKNLTLKLLSPGIRNWVTISPFSKQNI
jgi:hypothetical protein